jgi:hypothetical protein
MLAWLARTIAHWPVAALAVAAQLACSGGDGGSGEIHFAGSMAALPDMEIDTGLQPADSPAQVRVVARSAGEVTAEATASSEGTELVPVPGSGRVGMDATLSLEVFARLDASAFTFDDVVETVTIALAPGETTFAPFLLDGGEVSFSSPIVPDEILSVPLAGVPGGTITLSTTGGQVTGRFAGTCAVAQNGLASYAAQITWSGTVELAASIEIDTPLGGKTFGPMAVAVPIPEFATPFDLGTRSMADGAEAAGPSLCLDDPADDPDVSAPACGPDTCDGCCDGTTCVSGDQAERCGAGGMACTACESDFECDGGSGMCRPAGGSLWMITIEEGQFAAQDCGADGQWDGDGNLPDPYLVVAPFHRTVLGRTSTESNTLTASWFETFGPISASVLDQGIAFIAKDDDSNDDDPMGSCIPIAPGEFAGAGEFLVRCPRDCSLGDSGFDIGYRIERRY